MLSPLSNTLSPLARRRKAAAGAAPTLPYTTGLQLWLEADNIAGLADGDPVASWPDQSGRGNLDAIGLAGGGQPTFKAAILNGYPVVRFDGVANTLTGNYQSAGQSLTLGTLFVVASFAAATFPDYNGLYTDHGTEIFLIGTAGGTQFFGGAFGTDLRIAGVVTADFAPLATAKVVSGRRTPAACAGPYQVGTDRGIAGRNWKGDVAAILAYDSALADADRAAVEGYLMGKYGL